MSSQEYLEDNDRFDGTVQTMLAQDQAANVKCESSDEILKVFPVGCFVESTIGEGGPSEVFIGYQGEVYPFAYIDDYDITHFKIAKDGIDE